MAKTTLLFVMLFYASLLLMFASGRVGSADAGTELQAAVLFATTGNLGTQDSPGQLWVKSPNGRYYQCHDIGGVALMLPAAWLGSAKSSAGFADHPPNPSIVSRVGAALSYAIFSAIGCWFMFRLFAIFHTQRTAFLLSLVFATATIFWPYAKASWDVIGACTGVAMLMYFAAAILVSERPTLGNCVGASMAFVVACSFRYSLLPFMGVAIVLTAFCTRSKLAAKQAIISGATLAIGMLPTLVYNYVRMGSPFIPATRASQFQGNVLTGNILEAAVGLVAFPNRGLLFFSPIFVLLIGLPWVWRGTPSAARRLIAIFTVAAALYFLLIAKLRGWDAFGWGPRYLVPILPILFFPLGFILRSMWTKHRLSVVGLVLVSFFLAFAPVMVNWQLALIDQPNALDAKAPLPYAHWAVWKAAWDGLNGHPLSMPSTTTTIEPDRAGGARFPDLWTARLMEQSQRGLILGLTITVILFGMIVYSAIGIIRCTRASSFEDQPINTALC